MNKRDLKMGPWVKYESVLVFQKQGGFSNGQGVAL
jgi:hypothetical protein